MGFAKPQYLSTIERGAVFSTTEVVPSVAEWVAPSAVPTVARSGARCRSQCGRKRSIVGIACQRYFPI